MALTIADYLAETLAAAGVERIWGVTGDSLNGLSNSMRRLGSPRWMHTRHEEVAAFAAGVEALETGNLAVCAGSCGPGNLHLINGLYDCHRNRAPVLAIAAHIPSSEIGLSYVQETHPQSLFAECSHYVELVSHPEQFPRVLERAMRTALGERGVAVVVLPGDVALQEAPHAPPPWVPHTQTERAPEPADIGAMAAMLNRAEAVTLLCGSGCEGAHAEVVALAEALGAPVVHALRGKPFVEHDNPNSVGMTGLIGISSGYHAMEQCDVLLMLGSDFPYRNFYPTKAKVIQVDRDPAAIGRRVPVAMGLVAGVRETLTALLPHVEYKKRRRFLEKSLAHYSKSMKSLTDAAKPAPEGRPLHPQHVVSTLSDLAAPDAIFTLDVGTPTLWGARYLAMNGQRRLHGSFNHGSMANAMPQALGAQAAHPERQVVALCGDGGLSMLMGDLLSVRQLELPIKIIVLNNGSLGFVAMEMKAAGYLENGTDLVDTRFDSIAQAVGLQARRVEESADLADAMSWLLNAEGPALLDVVTDKQELAMPPKITLKHMKGFSLFMMKAVLSGRGNEVVEIARTALR